MAIETPNDPNTGGTGIEGSKYAEVAAPQFVGGQNDPNSGYIIPSNSNQAASAPAPQSSSSTTQSAAPPALPTFTPLPTPQAPTTQLANVNATGSSLLSDIGAGGGAALGDAAVSAPAASVLGLSSLNNAATSLGSGASNFVNGLTATAAPPAVGVPIDAFGSTTASDLAANASNGAAADAATAGSAAAGGTVSSVLGAAIPGLGAAGGVLLTGGTTKQAAESGVGAAAGEVIGNFVAPGIGGLVGSVLGSVVAQPIINAVQPIASTVERDVGSFLKRL